MFTISESNQKLFRERLDEAEEARASLDDSINEFNKKVAKLYRQMVTPALDDLNLAIEQVNNTFEDIHGEMEDFYDEQSEEFLESNAGVVLSHWMAEFDSDRHVDDVEIEEPEVLEMYDPELPDADELLSEP